MNENLGIMRFCFVCMRTIRAFVTDLDIRGPSSDSWRCSLDGGVGAPLLRGGGVLHEGGGVLAKGSVYCTKTPPSWSLPESLPVAPHPRVVRAGRHRSD